MSLLLGSFVLVSVMTIPATASAAECQKEAKLKFALCIGEPLILTETTGFEIKDENDTSHNFSWRSALGNVFKWVCTTIAGAGKIVATAVLVKLILSKLKFSSCTVSEPTHCTVREPIETGDLVTSILKAFEVELTPEAGSEFTTVTFESSGGTCVVAGKDKMTGEGGKGQACRITDMEKTMVSHLVECLETGSDLKMAGEAVVLSSYLLEKVLLSGTADKWAVIEGK